MIFYFAYVVAIVMGLWFVFFSDEDTKWRVVVGVYVACIGAFLLGLVPVHPVVPLLMSCLLVMIMVLYLKFNGYWS